MIPKLRMEKILEILSEEDVIFLEDISMKVQISKSTARRDLMLLQEQGQVEIMRGGAVRLKKYDHDEPVTQKKFINKSEKSLIAKKASDLVQEGDCIYIDSGTTAALMLDYLGDKKITIVTSSTLNLEKVNLKNIRYIILGGEIEQDLASVQGSLTEKMISLMYFDKSFIGANGYIVDEGIYTHDTKEAFKKELIINNSVKTYALLDTSKRNKKAFAKVENFRSCTIISEEN